MIQRLFQYLTQDVNPRICCTLYHTKLKGEHFLKRLTFDRIQDEAQLVFNMDQGQFSSSPTILTLPIVSINVMVLPIRLPSALEMREQWIKFRLRQSSHGKKKLRRLLDLMVRKHYPLPLEEENGSMHRVFNKRRTLR